MDCLVSFFKMGNVLKEKLIFASQNKNNSLGSIFISNDNPFKNLFIRKDDFVNNGVDVLCYKWRHRQVSGIYMMYLFINLFI